jgi:hypothetical protein
MTPIQKVVWTKNAKPREQLLMLRLMDVYGSRCEVTMDEMAVGTGMGKPTLIKTLRGLKELGWITTERVYKENGYKRLKSLSAIAYVFTV